MDKIIAMYSNNMSPLQKLLLSKINENKNFERMKTLDNGNILGILYDDNGEKIMEGEFDKNKRLKKGIIFYNGSKVAKGNFEYNKDNERYELNGSGEVFYQDTETVMLKGNFKNDKLDGKATSYNPDGTKLEDGNFKNGRLHGQNCTQYRNIAIAKGEFVGGVIFWNILFKR